MRRGHKGGFQLTRNIETVSSLTFTSVVTFKFDAYCRFRVECRLQLDALKEFKTLTSEYMNILCIYAQLGTRENIKFILFLTFFNLSESKKRNNLQKRVLQLLFVSVQSVVSQICQRKGKFSNLKHSKPI